MKKRINIIGAGFSGLSIAYYLKDSYEVVVHDTNIGGLLKTDEILGGIVDKSATTIVLNATIKDLFNAIGLDYVFTEESAKNRYIWRGKLSKFPLGFFETVFLIFKLIKSLITRSIKPKELETIESWSLRNLNKPALDFLISPIFQGIYAGDAKKLSASLIIGKKYKIKEKREGIVSARYGMQDLILKLKQACEASGVIFKQEKALLTKDDIFVIATNFKDAKDLLKDYNTKLAMLLNKIESVKITSANITLSGNYKEIKGFGLLIPQAFKFKTLGILSPTYTFANRGLNYNETFIISGSNHKDIKKLIEDERSKIMQDSGKIDTIIVSEYEEAFPHYTVDLEEALNEIKPILNEEKRIFLTGNYLGVIGLSDIAIQNKHLAEVIKEKVK